MSDAQGSGTGPAGPSGTTSSGRRPAEGAFAALRGLGAPRPDAGRWAAGVCQAVALRWGVDVTLVRGVTVVLGLFSGLGVLAYGLGWLLLPGADGRIHLEEAVRGRFGAGLVGSLLVVLFGLGAVGGNGAVVGAAGGGGAGVLVPLAAIAFVWWLVATRGGRGRPTGWPGTPGTPPGQGVPGAPGASYAAWTRPDAGAPHHGPGHPGGPAGGPAHVGQPYGQPWPRVRSSRTVTRVTLGTALLLTAGAALLDRLGVVALDTSLLPAVALVVVSAGLLVAGARGRRGGLLTPVALVLVLVVLPHPRWEGHLDQGVGDVTWRPTSASDVHYTHGVGTAEIDLTDPDLLAAAAADPGTTDVVAELGMGTLVVRVPAGVQTSVESEVGVGAVHLGDTRDGDDTDVQVTRVLGEGSLEFTVEAQVGVGRVVLVQP